MNGQRFVTALQNFSDSGMVVYSRTLLVPLIGDTWSLIVGN